MGQYLGYLRRSEGTVDLSLHLSQLWTQLLRYKHLVVVAYHPQANGIIERRIKEVMNHPRALVFENRIREVWSFYLPLVQRILNYSVDGSIGTQPARVIFEDVDTLDIAFEVPVEWCGRKVEDYLVKLREGQAVLIKSTEDYLKENQRKRSSDGHVDSKRVTKFEVGN